MKMKILVVTAECGEVQFKEQIQQLKDQKNVSITHRIISGLNLEDSQTMIYKICFQNRKSDYNFIVKLDGDMLFKDNRSLMKMCAHAMDIGKPRVTFKVFDYYTNRPINGIHFLVPEYIPEKRPIHVYRNDYWIETIQGKNTTSYPNEILHGFNSTLEQCERFGKSRGIKARGDGPNSSHWRTIYFLNKSAFYPQIKPDLIVALESALKHAEIFDIRKTYHLNSPINKFQFFYYHYKKYRKIVSTLTHLFKTVYLEIKYDRK